MTDLPQPVSSAAYATEYSRFRRRYGRPLAGPLATWWQRTHPAIQRLFSRAPKVAGLARPYTCIRPWAQHGADHRLATALEHGVHRRTGAIRHGRRIDRSARRICRRHNACQQTVRQFGRQGQTPLIEQRHVILIAPCPAPGASATRAAHNGPWPLERTNGLSAGVTTAIGVATLASRGQCGGRRGIARHRRFVFSTSDASTRQPGQCRP